jgi:hypothetical protein
VRAQIGRNLFAPIDTTEATALVRRALVNGERLAEPWVALAAFRFNHGDDPAGAVRALKRALLVAPSSGDAHDLTGRILLEADVWEDALMHLDRALWLDPLQRWARVDLMRAAALAGDWVKARELFDTGPSPEWAGHRMVHQARFWSWPGAPPIDVPELPSASDPRIRKIVEQYTRVRQARDAGQRLGLGEVCEPLERMLTGAPLQGRGRRLFQQMMAELAAIAGLHDEVLAPIEAAVNAGLLDLAWMSRLRLFDPLRGDPRFQTLHARVRERASQVVEAWRGEPETLEGALASLG